VLYKNIAKVLSPGLERLDISDNFLSDNLAIYFHDDVGEIHLNHPQIEYCLMPGLIDEY